MAEKNYLLGKGEKLTTNVEVPSGGGDKNPPYTFGQAKQRIAKKLSSVQEKIKNIPDDACPNQEIVAIITMHPRYISKSDFPEGLMKKLGIRSVGSRSMEIKPENWGIEKHPSKALTEQIFVAGKKESFKKWSEEITNWSEKADSTYADLIKIEDVTTFLPEDKIISIPESEKVFVEVVVHNSGRSSTAIMDSFFKYAEQNNADVMKSRIRNVKGLSFIPVRCFKKDVDRIAAFSFVRVVRGMPSIRPIKPTLVRGSVASSYELPTIEALHEDVVVAVFDGGLPNSVDLSRWVTLYNPPGIGAPDPDMVQHGLAVTSALLFGHLSVSEEIPRPFFKVDHYRVLDVNSNDPSADTEYLDILDRILKVFDEKKYDYVNLSLGPQMAVRDQEVTAWTAALDERLSEKDIFVAVAAGNDGRMDDELGLNRVQPPSDGVNVFSVGACGSNNSSWAKADYSCVGPGRRPGFVKPDGVAFGGSSTEPFHVLEASAVTNLVGMAGTSFATPLALRTATAVGCFIGKSELTPRALRALMIHKANAKKFKRKEVGWGRFETDIESLMTTTDDEILVIYQGLLPVGEHLRANVPFVDNVLVGDVFLTATLVISPEVDPEYPGAYTRSGLEVAFRPHSSKYKITKEGKSAAHPTTKPFFSNANLFGKSEAELRKDGHKWEPCLKHSLKLKAKSIHEPCFDIYYHHREGNAAGSTDARPIPYALVISIKAPSVPTLYNKTVSAYSHVLVPLKPRIEIPIRV